MFIAPWTEPHYRDLQTFYTKRRDQGQDVAILRAIRKHNVSDVFMFWLLKDAPRSANNCLLHLFLDTRTLSSATAVIAIIFRISLRYYSQWEATLRCKHGEYSDTRYLSCCNFVKSYNGKLDHILKLEACTFKIHRSFCFKMSLHYVTVKMTFLENAVNYHSV